MITFVILMSSLWVASLSQESMTNIQLSFALKFFQSGGRYYYDSLPVKASADPCKPNPCLYGGSCIPTDDQKDYQCTNCPHPMGGKNCSVLTGIPDCFKVGDSVFYVYPDTSRTFDESKSKCQEQGMTMPIIKDPTVHKGIRKHLTMINSDHIDDQICYWIGLHRASDSSPWKWTDGTELGDYDQWATGPYDGQGCADICSARYAYKFSGDGCEGVDGWKYITMCEKRFLSNV